MLTGNRRVKVLRPTAPDEVAFVEEREDVGAEDSPIDGRSVAGCELEDAAETMREFILAAAIQQSAKAKGSGITIAEMSAQVPAKRE